MAYIFIVAVNLIEVEIVYQFKEIREKMFCFRIRLVDHALREIGRPFDIINLGKHHCV